MIIVHKPLVECKESSESKELSEVLHSTECGLSM